MSHELFEVISQVARYGFVLIMLAITLRAVSGMLVDSRRAAKLRHMLPLTGQCGELLVINGGERAVKGMRYPVIREGIIGSSRRSDVRIRHSSIRRRHAYFQLTEIGLFVRTHAGSRLRAQDRTPVKEIWLADNASVWIGNVELRLVLNMPDSPVISTTGHGKHADAQRYERSEERERREKENELFGVENDRARRFRRDRTEESDYISEVETELPEYADEPLVEEEEAPRPTRKTARMREKAPRSQSDWRERESDWNDDFDPEIFRSDGSEAEEDIDDVLFGGFDDNR